MKTNVMLAAENINKIYEISKGNTFHVLRNVSLTIHQGEFVSVMGASGSGKSTLLYNVSGMDRVNDGRVTFCDEELTAMSEDRLSELRLDKMGFIFQQSNLLRNLSIFDNIILPAYQSGKESRSAINSRARKLMQHLGIDSLSDNDITQASGGQLQRASICRALINNPQFLFGDEPTGALNSGSTQEVMEILTEINAGGTTIMLVTHDPKVAARTHRVLFMSDGQIVAEQFLGPCPTDLSELRQREAALLKWLAGMGF